MTPYGYPIASGYIGYLDENHENKREFATETEYEENVKENE